MDVSLRDYIESRLDALEGKVDRGFETAALAVSKAEAAVDRRLEGMNEFRDAMRDQNSTFVRIEQFETLQSQVQELLQARRHIEGRIWGVGAVLTIVIALVQVVVRFIP